MATSPGSWTPGEEWEFTALAALVAFASDLLTWGYHLEFGWWLLPYFMVSLTASSAAIYIGAAEKLDVRVSAGGFIRFLATAMLFLLPIGTTLGAAVYAVGSDVDPNIYAVLISIVGLFLAIAVTMLLPAWPFAQSLNSSFVSPFRVLVATKGHRWSLIGLGFLLAGLSNNDLIPSATTAANIWQAMGIGLVDAFITAITLSLSASITAAAWKFAAANDPQLA